MKIPKFKTKEELFDYLVKHNEDIVYEKKAALKKADSFGFVQVVADNFTKTQKSSDQDSNENEIKVRAIINTTMVKDSHGDVHGNGMWNKTVKENKRIKHIQEHIMAFDKIISQGDDLKASVKKYDWRDLGVDADGKTEALVFDSVVKRSRNEFMFEQYKNGFVDNHSVGMYYVGKIKLALDSKDPEHAEFKATFDEYIDDILNKKEVKKDGWFYYVAEGKAVEGSAVPDGSNPFTPTLDIKTKGGQEEEKVDVKANAIKEWLLK